jgi:glycosyltransferase involved in cell wall biosynthesis
VPDISVVTLSYNQAEFLQQAMQSVFDQRSASLSVEYIVVDPGSTDHSRAIIETNRHKIDHVVLEPDSGPSEGLNKGFDLASADILYYLNADDYAYPSAFENALKFFKHNPSIDVLLASVDIVDRSGARIKRFRQSKFSVSGLVRSSSVVAQQGTFFRRTVWDSGVRFNHQNRTSWDKEFVLDIALRGGRFKSVDYLVAAFRIYGDSITGSGRLAQQHRSDFERMFELVYRRSPNKRDTHIHWIKRGVRLVSMPADTLERAFSLLRKRMQRN